MMNIFLFQLNHLIFWCRNRVIPIPSLPIIHEGKIFKYWLVFISCLSVLNQVHGSHGSTRFTCSTRTGGAAWRISGAPTLGSSVCEETSPGADQWQAVRENWEPPQLINFIGVPGMLWYCRTTTSPLVFFDWQHCPDLVWSCYISDKSQRLDGFNLIKEICWRATFASQFEIEWWNEEVFHWFWCSDVFIISWKCQKCWDLMQRFVHIIIDSSNKTRTSVKYTTSYLNRVVALLISVLPVTNVQMCGTINYKRKYLPDCMSAFFINGLLKPFGFQSKSWLTNILFR